MESLKKGFLKEIILQNKQFPISPTCRIRASNDAEAVERWLDEYFLKPTTFRTYKKEAERFLVWCKTVRSTNLASLDRADVEAYIEFLKNPQPKEVWCGPRRKKSTSPDGTWYPFAGPLGAGAIKSALTILNSLMSYLADARYLDFNPFALVRKKHRFKESLAEQSFSIHERILNDTEWQAILDTIKEEPEDDNHKRLRKSRLLFLITILYFLGLRIDELARATWNDCQKLSGKWWFFVRGKGDRLGKIPINTKLLHGIMSYRHAFGQAPLPENGDTSPLIFAMAARENPLTVRQMSNLIKELAQKAATKFDEHSPSHEKLLRFSPHWLRHLSASRQDLAGISFTNIKSNLRHQSEQTTRLYVHAYDDERHREMEKLNF
jgi:integrase